MRVPYLTESRIEAAAENTIACFERKLGCFEDAAVPLEEVAECLFNLDVRCENLVAKYGAQTLGAIWFESGEIRIDDSLNYEINPSQLGRYRFTLAHEIGHWVLHEPVARAHRQQGSFFDDTAEPSIICRAPLPRTKKEPIEWQADYFAGCLTMPRARAISAFEMVTGSRAPYCAEREIASLTANTVLTDNTPPLAVSRKVARLLKTSIQATQIKLLALGLITTNDPAPQLLDADEIAASYLAPELLNVEAFELK